MKKRSKQRSVFIRLLHSLLSDYRKAPIKKVPLFLRSVKESNPLFSSRFKLLPLRTNYWNDMATNGEITKGISTLYDTINRIIEEARAAVYRTANITIVRAYWHIGRVIVEEEQKGKERAEYGKQVLKQLSQKLTKKHGRGFDESNLRHMRNFYLVYPKCDALRPELSWTHYRLLVPYR